MKGSTCLKYTVQKWHYSTVVASCTTHNAQMSHSTIFIIWPTQFVRAGPAIYIYFDTSASARHEVLPNASTWCFFTFSLCPQFSGFNAHTYVLTPSLPPLLAVLHPTHPSGGQPSPFLAVNSPPPPSK